jgi:hypothetical protein
MNEEQKVIVITMMESYTTYENHGTLKIDLENWVELDGKDKNEIAEWLNNNSDNLFVDTTTGEIKRDQFYKYDQEELDDMLVNGEEKEVDEDIIPLYEYRQNTEVISDRIKNEQKYLYI